MLTCACVAVHKFAPNRAIFRCFFTQGSESRKKQTLDLCGRLYCFKSMDGSSVVNQWIGLRENLQEPMDFPIKYGFFMVFPVNFPLKPIH